MVPPEIEKVDAVPKCRVQDYLKNGLFDSNYFIYFICLILIYSNSFIYFMHFISLIWFLVFHSLFILFHWFCFVVFHFILFCIIFLFYFILFHFIFLFLLILFHFIILFYILFHKFYFKSFERKSLAGFPNSNPASD